MLKIEEAQLFFQVHAKEEEKLFISIPSQLSQKESWSETKIEWYGLFLNT